MRSVLLLAALLPVAAGASLPAGLISFRRVPIPDDVPAHLCTALAQDREGFLWMGTQAGLVRFDPPLSGGAPRPGFRIVLAP